MDKQVEIEPKKAKLSNMYVPELKELNKFWRILGFSKLYSTRIVTEPVLQLDGYWEYEMELIASELRWLNIKLKSKVYSPLYKTRSRFSILLDEAIDYVSGYVLPFLVGTLTGVIIMRFVILNRFGV